MAYKQIFIRRFLMNYLIFLHKTEKVTFGAQITMNAKLIVTSITELFLLVDTEFYLRCKGGSLIKRKKVRRSKEQQ